MVKELNSVPAFFYGRQGKIKADKNSRAKTRVSFTDLPPKNELTVYAKILSDKVRYNTIDNPPKIRNPLIKRRFTLLRIKETTATRAGEIQIKESWVLVNKASLKHRLGVNLKDIKEKNISLEQAVNDAIKKKLSSFNRGQENDVKKKRYAPVVEQLKKLKKHK